MPHPTHRARPCSTCGTDVSVRQFMNTWGCPAHTPAALAGHPEPAPDPAETLAAIRGDQPTASPTADLERARAVKNATEGARDGATYTDFDYDRLTGQARRVFDVMRDGKWRTLAELADATGDPSPSIQARMRDFRKPQYGALTMEAETTDSPGVWKYRLLTPGLRRTA